MGIPGSHSVPIGNGPAAGRPIGGGPAAGPAAGSVSNGSSRAMHNGGGHILGSGRSQDSQSMRSTERKDGMMINNDDSKERELVMQRLQEVKLSKEEEERKRMHEAIERENAMMKDLEEFREKRKEKERALVSMFHDPRDAIANIKEEYGAARLQVPNSSHPIYPSILPTALLSCNLLVPSTFFLHCAISHLVYSSPLPHLLTPLSPPPHLTSILTLYSLTCLACMFLSRPSP